MYPILLFSVQSSPERVNERQWSSGVNRFSRHKRTAYIQCGHKTGQLIIPFLKTLCIIDLEVTATEITTDFLQVAKLVLVQSKVLGFQPANLAYCIAQVRTQPKIKSLHHSGSLLFTFQNVIYVLDNAHFFFFFNNCI